MEAKGLPYFTKRIIFGFSKSDLVNVKSDYFWTKIVIILLTNFITINKLNLVGFYVGLREKK